MSRSIILLSAGLDSTVNLFLARKKTTILQTLTFNYGQRAAPKEIDRSKKLSNFLGIPHMVVELPWLKIISHSALTNEKEKIPTGREVSIDDFQISSQSAQSVWVPNRNGVFLNVAASFAESLNADYIVPGFNLEEATTFPDNSQEFINATDAALKHSTRNHVKVHCETTSLNKLDIMRIAVQEKIPLELMWPCYFEGDRWCGQCESCQRTKRAMVTNQIDIKRFFS